MVADDDLDAGPLVHHPPVDGMLMSCSFDYGAKTFSDLNSADGGSFRFLRTGNRRLEESARTAGGRPVLLPADVESGVVRT